MSSQAPSEQLLGAYDQYSDAIFRYCFVRLRQREVALDLTQDAFIRTWEYLRQGNSIENIRAFLYRVANNLIIDYVRKRRESSLDSLMEQGFDVPFEEKSILHAKLDAQYALKVVDKLDDKYRDVVVLRYIEDLPIKEIAQIIGESENVVSVRLHRAIQQVKKLSPTHDS